MSLKSVSSSGGMSQSTLIVGTLLLGFVVYTIIIGTYPKYLGFFLSPTAAPAGAPASAGGEVTPGNPFGNPFPTQPGSIVNTDILHYPFAPNTLFGGGVSGWLSGLPGWFHR